MLRRPPRLATQLLLVQISVSLLLLGAGFLVSADLLRRESESQFEQRALAVARTTADDPLIVDPIVAGHDPAGEVQRQAERIRRHTGMLFIVVTDAHGIRYSHPDPARIGKRVSTDPTALSGTESVSVERGTLGVSARAKVPLRTTDGRIVGEVSTGVQVTAATAAATPMVRAAAVFAAVALLVSTAAAVLLARRLKRRTLGLEPGDLADLLRKQQAVLGGVGDGVLAVDEANRVTVCNAQAARLIGGSPPPGTPVARSGLPPVLEQALAQRLELRQTTTVVGDRLVVVNAQPVRRGEQDLGHVLTLRDRTEVDGLQLELSALRALSDALRAQAHEYTNRLHTLSGMLASGDLEAGQSFLRELTAAPLATEGRDGARLADPYLRGLLAAKTATASERGIDLRLVADSHLPRRLTEPLDVVSVVGNLLDNAIRAAAEGRRTPGWVELNVLAEADTLHVAVVDSGDGVAADDAERLFQHGFTTRPKRDGDGHGIGLPLARQFVAKHSGELRLVRPRGADHGAVFIAQIPGVIEPPDTDWAGGTPPAPPPDTGRVGGTPPAGAGSGPGATRNGPAVAGSGPRATEDPPTADDTTQAGADR